MRNLYLPELSIMAIRYIKTIKEGKVDVKRMRYEHFLFLTNEEWEALLYHLIYHNNKFYNTSNGPLFILENNGTDNFLVPTDFANQYKDTYVNLTLIREDFIKRIVKKAFKKAKEASFEKVLYDSEYDYLLHLYPVNEWRHKLKEERDKIIQKLIFTGDHFETFHYKDLGVAIQHILNLKSKVGFLLGSTSLIINSNEILKKLEDIVFERFYTRLLIERLNELIGIKDLEELKNRLISTDYDDGAKLKGPLEINERNNEKNTKKLKCLFNKTQIMDLFNELKGKFIDPITTPEQFQDVFDIKVTKMITPINWIGDTDELVYLIIQSFNTVYWQTYLGKKEAFRNCNGTIMKTTNYASKKSTMPPNRSFEPLKGIIERIKKASN